MEKKIVVFSFDDGRKDTYTNSVRILKKYGFTATIHVATDFINNPEKYYDQFISADGKAMAKEEIVDCYNNGFEITSHGDTHINEANDFENSIKLLKEWGVINENFIGFSSPNSKLNEKNLANMLEVFDRNHLKYIRSGIKIREKSLLYKLLYVIQKITKSRFLYYMLNKEAVIKKGSNYFIQAISVKSYNTISQLKYLIDKTPVGNVVILLFHSVLYKYEKGYSKDDWYFDAQEFERFCVYLSEKKERVEVMTISNALRALEIK